MVSRAKILEKVLASRTNRSLNGRGTVSFRNDDKHEIMTVTDHTDYGVMEFNLDTRQFLSCTITDTGSNCGGDVLHALENRGYIPRLRIHSWYGRWQKLHYIIDLKPLYLKFKDKDQCWGTDLVLPYFNDDVTEWGAGVLKPLLKNIMGALDMDTYVLCSKRGWKITLLKPGRPRNYKKRIKALFDTFQQYVKGVRYEWVKEDLLEVIVDGNNIKVYNKPKGTRNNLRKGAKTFTLV